MGLVLRFAVAALLLAPGPALHAQSDASTLRWVRGRVASNSPGTIVLQLRDGRPLAVACDTRCAAASPGSLVELHYVDRKGERRAEHLFVGPAADGELSRRPGRSVRGLVIRARTSSVQLQVGTKKRSYEIERKATFVEAGGWQPVATGRDAIAARIRTGEEVLLKYEEDDSSIQAGEVTIPGTTLKAVEVRRLKG